MGIGTRQAEEEFVAHRLADDIGAGREQAFDRGGVLFGGQLIRKPIGTAAAGAFAGDVVHVLDRYGQTRERP
jgi:hypothetical protein